MVRLLFRLIVLFAAVCFLIKPAAANDRAALTVKLRSELEWLEQGEGSEKERAKRLTEVRALCSQLQLGPWDQYSGAAVAGWARLQLLAGDWAGGRDSIMSQAEALQAIEKGIGDAGGSISCFSPWAECRYVLGLCFKAERKSADSDVARCRASLEALRHFLNVETRYSESEWASKAGELAGEERAFLESFGREVHVRYRDPRQVMANRFKAGARRLLRGEYAEAEPLLLEALNAFPSAGDVSVDGLVNLGRCWLALDRIDDLELLLSYLSERYGNEPLTPMALMTLGQLMLEAGLKERAEQTFKDCLVRWPEDERLRGVYALFAGWAWDQGRFEEAAEWFEQAAAREPDPARKRSLLEVALDGWYRSERWADGVRVCHLLEESVEGEALEKVVYQRALCLSRLTDVELALESLNGFLESYPASRFGDDIRNATLLLLLRAERLQEAGQMLEELLQEDSTLSVPTVLCLADALLEAGEYAWAEKAYAAVVDSQHPAAGIGYARALFGAGKTEAALACLEADAGDGYEVLMLKGELHTAVGQMELAEACYGQATIYARSAVERYRASLALASASSDLEKKLGIYQRVALLADPKVRELKPLIIEALAGSMACCRGLGRLALYDQCYAQLEAMSPGHPALAERWDGGSVDGQEAVE
jgi:tetratricopeptide (TPR) repeat protein